jgi:hypothetical protein
VLEEDCDTATSTGDSISLATVRCLMLFQWLIRRHPKATDLVMHDQPAAGPTAVI